MYMFDFLKKEEIGQAIGLDIGTSTVKVVQLRKEKNRIVLDTYGEVALGPYAGLKIGQAARLAQQDTQTQTRTAQAGLNLGVPPVETGPIGLLPDPAGNFRGHIWLG
jgi:activator of 2-hydroxyglutaryl-CoA dehydratase